MSYIKLPVRITKAIDKTIRDFVWGPPIRKKMHLVNWATVTRKKDQGGLGLHRFETRNKAILASLAWRMLQHPGKLWARILVNKHKSSPYNGPMSRVVSRTWKNIQRSWEDISTASKWVVTKEPTSSFWGIHGCQTTN